MINEDTIRLIVKKMIDSREKNAFSDLINNEGDDTNGKEIDEKLIQGFLFLPSYVKTFMDFEAEKNEESLYIAIEYLLAVIAYGCFGIEVAQNNFVKGAMNGVIPTIRAGKEKRVKSLKKKAKSTKASS